MPYERCIGTWAREGGIPWIPGPGRRGTGQVRAWVQIVVLLMQVSCRKIMRFGYVFRLDVHEKPILKCLSNAPRILVSGV